MQCDCRRWHFQISVGYMPYATQTSKDILPLTVCVNLYSKFSRVLRKKTISFLQEWRFTVSAVQCRPRWQGPWFWFQLRPANRKRVYDFPLVLHSNLYLLISCAVSEIAICRFFVLLTPPLFHPAGHVHVSGGIQMSTFNFFNPNFGGVPVALLWTYNRY